MNTFIIYQYDSTILFNRICHSPPSLEDTNIILAVLEKCKFSSLGYRIDIIHGNNHQKITGLFYSADKFIHYLTNLCKDGVKFGVVMYLNR